MSNITWSVKNLTTRLQHSRAIKAVRGAFIVVYRILRRAVLGDRLAYFGGAGLQKRRLDVTASITWSVFDGDELLAGPEGASTMLDAYYAARFCLNSCDADNGHAVICLKLSVLQDRTQRARTGYQWDISNI